MIFVLVVSLLTRFAAAVRSALVVFALRSTSLTRLVWCPTPIETLTKCPRDLLVRLFDRAERIGECPGAVHTSPHFSHDFVLFRHPSVHSAPRYAQ